MAGSQMLDKGRTLRPWGIPEAVARSIFPIQHNKAFQTAVLRRKFGFWKNVLFDEPPASDHLKFAGMDNAFEAMSRCFANFRHFQRSEILRLGRTRDGLGQRMFGITLKT